MRTLSVTLLALAATAFLTGSAQAEEKKQKQTAEQKLSMAEKTKDAPAFCPVNGKPIDMSMYTYHKNRRVYFCSAKSKKAFEAQPAKYTAGVKKQWEAMPLFRTQVNCPVTKKPIKSAHYVEESDMRVYFASEEAKKTWESHSSAKRGLRASQMFTFQTKCVISGNGINPEVYRDLKGERVYFFCPKCAAEGEKAPDETSKKAKKQAEKNSNAFTMHELGRLKKLLEEHEREQAKKKKAG